VNNTQNKGIALTDAADDRSFALAARLGDQQAFGILFERYQPRIFAIAMRYTRIAEDAEDIVQQTFQKAFIHLRRFEAKSSFSTWLTRIAINEALMLLRKERTLREVSIEGSMEGETVTHGVEIPDPLPDPEADYLKREATEILRSAIDKLRARLRTTVELRELGELSSQETARRMGVSVAAVKTRAFQGRRKLRKILRRAGIAPKRIHGPAIARGARRPE